MPQRYIIAGMIFFAIVGLLMMRTCMSMTLTQMVKPTAVVHSIYIDETACPMPTVVLHDNGTIKAETVPNHSAQFRTPLITTDFLFLL